MSAGGKGAGLRRLAAELPVPRMSVVGVDCFDRFVAATGLKAAYATYWRAASAGTDEEALATVRSHLTRAFLLLAMPPDIAAATESASRGFSGLHVAVRSSADVEDASAATWAGQFLTVFTTGEAVRVDEAVRLCWASTLRPSVASYGRAVGRREPPSMGVVVQQAVDAVAAGVVVAHPVGRIVLEATVGLGGTLVGGLVSPERWEKTADQEGALTLTRCWQLGSVWMLSAGPARPASSRWLRTPAGQRLELRTTGERILDGLEVCLPVSREPSVPVLGRGSARAIAAAARDRAARVGAVVELEWAITDDGELWWLQEREVPGLSAATPVAPGRPAPDGLIVGGTGAPGVACGPGWWPSGGRPRPNDRPIVFLSAATPHDVPAVLDSVGVVTQDTGLLSHSAILCRELGLPCLVSAESFPPAVDVDRMLVLDATRGVVTAAIPGATWGGLSNESPRVPSGDVIRALRPAAPDTAAAVADLVTWHVSDKLRQRLSPLLCGHLRRVATVAGVVGSVDVFPDVRLPQEGLGFPVGVVFRSDRYHPTATGDVGDGFRVAELVGVPAEEVEADVRRIARALLAALADDGDVGAEARATLSLDDLCGNGLAALVGTPWEERRPHGVEGGGMLPGGSAAALRDDVARLARRCLTWHGEAGHFLEVVVSDHADGPARVFVTFHTGTMEAGLLFLRDAVQRGATAARRAGVDDPARIASGLWGLDPTAEPGASLLAGAVGLTNYAYARRALLQRLTEAALRTLFVAAELRLVSDVVHSAVRPYGDALLYQQGVQAVRPGGVPLPVMLAGAPRVPSWLVTPESRGPECWAGHGRVQIGHLHELLPAQSLGRGSDALLVGPDLLDATVDVYSAQIREAVDEMTRDVATRSKVALRPLLCLRGNRNGQRKLRERTPLWPDAPETVQVNALDIVDEIRRQAGEVDTIDHVGPGYTVSKGQQARVANVEQNVLLEQVGKHSRKFRICTTAWSNRADRPAMHNAGRPGPCLRPAGHPGTRGPRVATGRRVGGGAQRPGGACIAGRSSGAGHGTPRHAVSIRRCC